MDITMKVLWLSNFILPIIAEDMGEPCGNKEGWLVGLSQTILEKGCENGIELGICFPLSQPEKKIKGSARGITYYSFYETVNRAEKTTAGMQERLREIIEDFRPDIVHIFGTEYAHSLEMLRAFGHPERTLIGMQGVCSACAKRYMAALPDKVQNKWLLRDILRWDNIKKQQEKFAIRGQRERQVLREAVHVTGRTRLDKEEVLQTNKKAVYHFMNETLRGDFYDGQWSYENCEKHTVFMSQGDYPLKGLHLALEGIGILKKTIPDVRLYVAGNRINKHDTWKEKLKLSSYGQYINVLLRRYDLEDSVIFTGSLTSGEMKKRFIRSNIYLMASSMENSPNSLGEAMLLGMPVVSSCVGGVEDMLVHEKEGFLYTYDQPQEMAHYLQRMLEDREMAVEMGLAAKEHAKDTHNREKNYKRLIEIYQEIEKTEK